jgi:hypothetical protein
MDKRLHLAHWLRPGLLTLLGLIPLMIWLALLYQRGGIQAVTEVLLTNSVGRFSGSFVEAGHFEPFYYYLAKLPEAFCPGTFWCIWGCGISAKNLMPTVTCCSLPCGYCPVRHADVGVE